MDTKEILKYCDHTLLAQTATWEDIKAIIDDGIKYETASVCIPPGYVAQAKDYAGNNLKICTVIGFPNGYNTTAVKAFETSDALDNGADEILGFHVIGPRATDLAAEVAAVMECEGTISEIGSTVHPHPTVSEVVMEAAHVCHNCCINAPKVRG